MRRSSTGVTGCICYSLIQRIGDLETAGGTGVLVMVPPALRTFFCYKCRSEFPMYVYRRLSVCLGDMKSDTAIAKEE